MGKNKGANRTKGNVQPSSSGRSAELLGGVTSFVGFGGLKDLGYVPAATQASFEDDSQISAELRVTLRKMTKKDTVTKIKALQEFESFCATESVDSIKTALPFWPRLYCKLVMDCERRVRESTHSVQKVVVGQIGKLLAPHLRSIMPTWLISMTDPHQPAATAACKSFQSAFSEEKRPGVIFFCQHEIVAFISDNLFVQNAQTLSDPRMTSKEDQESKYIRFVLCSLKGLSLFLEMTKDLPDKKTEIVTSVSCIISQDKFWAYSKNQNSQIRSSWFDTIKSLCEFDVKLLNEHLPRLAKILFSSLDCTDAVVLPHIWVAFLNMCVWLPKCWDHSGNLQSVFNRMNSVLRDGGRGAATELTPHLLPILSVICKSHLEDEKNFITEFFRALASSLTKDKVVSNRREIFLLNIALHECLKFVSKTEKFELLEILIKYQVVELLFNSFNETPELAETNYFQEVSKLQRFWAKCGLVELLESFWTQFLPLCQVWIEESDEKKLTQMKKFLQVLKNPNFIISQKRLVRFQPQKSIEDSSILQMSAIKEKSAENSSEEQLRHYLVPLFKCCLSNWKSSEDEFVFDLLTYLVLSFSDERTMDHLIEPRSDDFSANRVFLQDYIQPIFYSSEVQGTVVENAIELFFHMFPRMGSDEQNLILEEIKPSIKTKALCLLVERMCELSNENSTANKWLQGPFLGCRLFKCLQQFCAISLSTSDPEEGKQLNNLLNFVFENGNKKECLFSTEYLSQMLKFLGAALTQNINLLSLVLSFVKKHLESSVSGRVPGLEDVLRSFFHLLFFQRTIQGEHSKSVKDCITTYLSQESTPMPNQLLIYILNKSKELILMQNCSFDVTFELIEFLKSIFSLFSVQNDRFEPPVICTSLETVLPNTKEWNRLESNLSSLCVRDAMMTGSIACRDFPPDVDRGSNEWDITYPRVCLLVSSLLETLSSLALVDAHRSLVASCLHAASYSHCMLDINARLHHCEVDQNMRMVMEKLKSSLQKVISKMDLNSQLKTLSLIMDKSVTGRHDIWSMTLSCACRDWFDLSADLSPLVKQLDTNRLGFSQTIQALIPHLQLADVMETLTAESNHMSFFDADPREATGCISQIYTSLTRLENADQSETREVVKAAIHKCFDGFVQWRDSGNNFLFACDIDCNTWEETSMIVCCLRMMTSMVRSHAMALLHSHWDVILCSLSTWVHTLAEAKLLPHTNKIHGVFACATGELAAAVSDLIFLLRQDSNLRQEYPPTLLEEWDEFFAPNIFQVLFRQFLEANALYQQERVVMLHHVVGNLSRSVNSVNKIKLEDLALPIRLNAHDDADTRVPEHIQSFMNHICPVLWSYHPLSQCSAYSILQVSMKEWMDNWDQNQADVDDKDVLPQRSLPQSLLQVVQQTGSLVEVALQQVDIGSCCEVVVHTDSHTLTTGYLLAWLLILDAVASVSEQNQQLYFSFIRETGMLCNLLNNLFRLMPTEPIVKDKTSSETLFNTPIKITPEGMECSESLGHLACHLYLRTLKQMPAAARSWFTNLDRNKIQIVDKFTCSYVSPCILASEMESINEPSVKYDNMTFQIKSRPLAREVVVVYTIDEANMELTLKLATNHPLSIICVDDYKRIGVSMAQWRNWLFGLNTMLSHRNTPLVNSLEFWRKNVDQKFKGLEECYICYYVLHGTTNRIPKLLCRTCKKKFHSACLYKWFNTSNNSTCPLCRSLF